MDQELQRLSVGYRRPPGADCLMTPLSPLAILNQHWLFCRYHYQFCHPSWLPPCAVRPLIAGGQPAYTAGTGQSLHSRGDSTFCVKWRHSRHRESLTSYEKFDSHQSINISINLTNNNPTDFTPSRFETTEPRLSLKRSSQQEEQQDDFS